MGQREPCEIQQAPMQSLTPGEEEPPAATQAGHCLAREQLCWKDPGAQQAGHGPAWLQRWQTASRAVSRRSQTVD